MPAATQSNQLPSPASEQDTYSFTLLLSGFNTITDEIEQALFNAGCDDALLGVTDGQAFLNFDREAQSLPEAIFTAIKDVEKSGLDIKVVQIVPPGERVIGMFNALLSLRNDKPELCGLVEQVLSKLAR